ncbi:ABC transporter permease [Staphylococcus americanisciuri]|uniref:ABC transporter permease n=1 Tax=Staphylococcus americanisciuri TaxID=2973940 RepID=A0ABT2F1I3_9STAP|nr:ABC transporter permease [Staphylococcus americanisciuri]MCS4485715.1 ABC transporter permease [Staphylococcus americanisciuri]
MLFLKMQFLKMKRTSIVPIMLGLPIVTVSLFACLAFFAKQTDLQMFRVTSLQLFLELILPLAMTLIVGLMFRIERRNHAFQNTVTYFKSLKTYYLLNFVFYVFIGFIMLWLGYLLYAVSYVIFTQQWDLIGVDFVCLLIILMLTFLPIISFIYMLNYLFQGFVLPAVLSFLLTVGNFFVGVIGIFASHLYFYSFLVFTLYNGYNKLILIATSLLLSLIFLTIGYIKFLKSMEKGQL